MKLPILHDALGGSVPIGVLPEEHAMFVGRRKSGATLPPYPTATSAPIARLTDMVSIMCNI